MGFISSLILIIFLLVGVAFLTLLERKGLGYIQLRYGPNKVGVTGVVQPLGDALKLFYKEQIYPLDSNFLVYFITPGFSLFISLLVWICLPLYCKILSFNLGGLFFICCLRLGVYSLIIAGWSSNSNYSLLGGLRRVAQTISYEVRLVLIFLSIVFLVLSFNLHFFIKFQVFVWFILFMFPLFLMWFCSSLAEVNRTPFDLAEGESELVSGFNVEYRRGGFAIIFLAEYLRILFMRIIISLIFLGGDIYSIVFYFKVILISWIFIVIRGACPRFRYDKLIDLCWKSFLPISLNYIFFVMGWKLLFWIIIIFKFIEYLSSFLRFQSVCY